MASGITLSAGVRQNLLNLQSTASLISSTQNKLATGKRVNSALDNPSNFFTSQSLADRAGDLNNLLDSIGQATKTLEAADKGLTSLTKLVQSAKSIAQQARQATAPVASYSAVDVSGTVGGTESLGSVVSSKNLSPKAISLDFTNQTETMGTFTGGTMTNAAIAGTDDVVIDVTVGGTTTQVTVQDTDLTGENATDAAAAIQAAIDASAVGAGMITVSAGGGGNGAITMTAANADVDFTITANTTTEEMGLTVDDTTDRTTNSTSLLDNIIAAGGSAGASLELQVNGGTTETVTFTNAAGADNVSTLAELNTWLGNNGGAATASVSGASFQIDVAAGTTNTLRLEASSAAVKTALGLGTAATAVDLSDGDTRGGLGTAATALERTYNSNLRLDEIDPAFAGGNISISVDRNDGNGASVQVIGLEADDTLDDVVGKLRANNTIDSNIEVSNVAGALTMTSKTADVDFTISGSAASAALGVTASAVASSGVNGHSTSLLDNLVTAGGAAGQRVTIKANGGATQTLTFGKESGQISTLADLKEQVEGLSGVTATLNGTALSIGVAEGSKQTSIEIGGDALAVTQLGVAAYTGTTSGTKSEGTASSTRESLQNDFNNVLDQIDSLSKDASYNGINLLNGDDLKVSFNEDGSSSLTIKGVTFDSSNLGLNKVTGEGFQDNAKIDAVVTAASDALTSLRTQSSKFGSNLTTVQTRQEFTKNMVTTLQTGSDALVLADSNEEAANLLALQTRQQLSSTALSLASQADQAVLRLF